MSETPTVNAQPVSFVELHDSGRLHEVHRNGLFLSRYEYDANGNRLAHITPTGTVTATYDDQDRLLTYGDATYTYTANGELATKTQNGQTTRYEYDELGSLVKVTLPDGVEIEYVIDGQGRRVGKRVGGVLVAGWLYKDQLEPVAEINGFSADRFIYASRPNTPDVLIKGGQSYHLITDHLGSPRLVVNTADGTIAQQMSYDEFGRVTLDTAAGLQSVGFAGGLNELQVQMVRFGARDYDAGVGRWMGKDPALFGGRDTNLYNYVLNDPINYFDPRGWMKLPADPKGLGPEWVHDTDHLDPDGARYRGPNGDILDFHRGKPGRPRQQGKDHWHHYPGGEGQRHRPLSPGDEIPDPEPSQDPACRITDYSVRVPAIEPNDVAIAIGIGIIVGTLIEDIFTGGVGILDDPATLSAGFGLIAGGLR